MRDCTTLGGVTTPPGSESLPTTPEPTPDQAAEGAPPGSRSRTLLVGLAAVVALGVAAFALASGGGESDGGPTVACGGAPAEADPALVEGDSLTPRSEPDALPPAQLCAFSDDTPVDVEGWLGAEPLVINFWATWCAPCVAEMPDFQEVHEAADGRFRLIGINTQDSPALAPPFVADLGITYDLVRDPRGEYFNATNGFGMPTTLFVAPDGDIRYRHTGPLSIAAMAELLAEHLDVELQI